MSKNGASEEDIQAAINAIELTEIQRNHLTFENYDNLIHLRISNCPLIDSKSFVKKLLKLNSDGKSYRTNLRNFRMEDINWTITEDECEFIDVIEDGVSKRQISEIPILNTLMEINGINNADDTIDRQEAGNDYFAGIITIDNSDLSFGVNEYILYNKYEKLFPNLKFKYTESIRDENNNIIATNPHNTKAYFIGINNALNQADPKYSKKIAATEIDDIASNLIDWFTPTKLEDGSWDATHVPPFTKTQNNKYEYKFIGWSIDKSKSFDEDKYAVIATKQGLIKRIKIDKLKVSRYSKVVMATKLREGDEVVSADMMSGSSGEIVICTKDGFMNRYDAEEVSIIEPASFGVKSIELKSRPNDYVVGAKVVKEKDIIVVLTNRGNVNRMRPEEINKGKKNHVGKMYLKVVKSNTHK